MVHVAHMEEMRNGKPRYWWEDTRMDHREMGWESMMWIQVAQDRDQWKALVNMVMKLQVL